MAVVIYTTPSCPYCRRAKELLTRKGVSYQEIDVTNPSDRENMRIKANGRRTVPQIFINDYHVGGCDDIYSLEEQGKLDSLLK